MKVFGSKAPAGNWNCVLDIPLYIHPSSCSGKFQDRAQLFRHLDSGVISHHVFIILLYMGGDGGF